MQILIWETRAGMGFHISNRCQVKLRMPAPGRLWGGGPEQGLLWSLAGSPPLSCPTIPAGCWQLNAEKDNPRTQRFKRRI